MWQEQILLKHQLEMSGLKKLKENLKYQHQGEISILMRIKEIFLLSLPAGI